MRYLRSRRKALLVGVLSAGIFGVTFALYGFPWEAVAYPALLYAGIALMALWADFRAVRKRVHAILDPSRKLPEDESPEGAAYQTLIERITQENSQLQASVMTRQRERLEDFTVWAHQIKTPIASMRLRLSREDSDISRALGTELTRVDQYAEMALAYLRLDSESTDYVLRSVSVDEIICQALRRFKGDFIAKRLSVEYQPVSQTVVSDEKWLLFVLEQVLSNAVKYTFSGGVTITMTDGVLTIADTGIGIAAADLPRIFEKGYTGLNGRIDQKATGLGLYLCSRVCRKLGHGLAAASEAGQGTAVSIDLRQKAVEPE